MVFRAQKVNRVWVWIALCRKTRQVIAYVLGDRSKQTCQRLWDAIPDSYRQGHCFTDFWGAYAAVIPEEQHPAVGKETGETAHVERWNNTLRQRLARPRPHDLLVFQVCDHARGVPALVSPSLQSRAGHPA
jgi:insertion element IS1 protein InsB